ncbi:MAG: glycoside hydrolase family 5 protein [Clostridiales bacterium]|jgi:endoglucanase|nr:glycoside hydrolase family 5 protein [Clostridiales bacterium]
MEMNRFYFVCVMFIALILFSACGGSEIIEINEPEVEATEAPAATSQPGLVAPSVNNAPVIPAPGNSDARTTDESGESDGTNPRDIAVVINLTEAPAPSPNPWRNAEAMVADMQIGWNLGNTLDTGANPSMAIELHETSWGNPITTRENIEAIHAAGFDVLRVPVTWNPRLVRNTEDYSIREDWMNRVQEVVDYGMELGMFVILNTHHDEPLFSLYDAEMENSEYVISRLWEQIAYVFRDYDHRLIFEGINEPRTKGSRAEWNGGTPEERNNVNVLNQVFVDTVRASGGNNSNRMLMVATYAAAVLDSTISDFVLPVDPANSENMLIVSLHMYAPYEFALATDSNMRHGWSTQNRNDTDPIIRGLDLAYNYFVSNGIPVIMGEMGALNRNNTSSRVNWTTFYVSEAANRNILCVWWDNGLTEGATLSRTDEDFFGIFNRRTNTFPFPEIIDALMSASE